MIFPFVIVLMAVGVQRIGAPWVRASMVALVVMLGLATSLLAIVQRDRTEVGQLATTIETEGKRRQEQLFVAMTMNDVEVASVQERPNIAPELEQ